MAVAPQLETRRPLEEGGCVKITGNAHDTRPRPPLDTTAPVNQNGCFDFDRVIKCGYVQKRTQKTKNWKAVYLVLRPNAISLYKNEKETKLRHQIYHSDLSAVAVLKDPKHKRKNLFSIFSPSRNYHFEAQSPQDAREWVELIRKEARLEEDEEEMLSTGPGRRSLSPGGIRVTQPSSWKNGSGITDNILSSSPENHGIFEPPAPSFMAGSRRVSSNLDSSGLSANEMFSYSDFSDAEGQRIKGPSLDNLASSPEQYHFGSLPRQPALPGSRPNTEARSASQVSAVNAEQESERVVWHGQLWLLRSKGGVRQWKTMWGVLRARNFILYKDKSEYLAQWVVDVADVVDVVDIDPISKSKKNCLQIIAEEKSYRLCTEDEESIVQFIGAFKSLLAKRRGFEARAAATKASL